MRLADKIMKYSRADMLMDLTHMHARVRVIVSGERVRACVFVRTCSASSSGGGSNRRNRRDNE